MFNIQFADGVFSDLSENEASGIIEIGGFKEDFIAPLNYWSRKKYETHWQNEIRNLIENKTKVACLVTSIPHMKNKPFVAIWVIYIEGREAIFQNMLLNTAEDYKDFDENNPACCLPDRTAASEDGDQYSEWCISVDSLKNFTQKD